MLILHNTPTKKDEVFKPLQKERVTLYTCGPTVYNAPHIGNWVAYIRWDILVRTLIANGYTVERVMNITDVGHLTGENDGDADQGEDKLQKGARREGTTAWEVAKRYTQEFLTGMHQLNLITPNHITKATDFIPQQIALIQTLKEKGYTYQIDDGIYFDTSKFPRYADFANLHLAALQAGARVSVNEQKRNVSDFALWKFSPKNEQRDMEWDTPSDITDDGKARKGFPGWHLECSAMAMDILGETIDIHTGGIDHIPVHHTNEIAQSEAATGKPFSRYWLHNNHLKSNGTKISKSLGNGYTLVDIAERGFSPLDFRMFILQSHYRSESNFTWENLEAAKRRLEHWQNVARLRWQTFDTLIDDDEKATNAASIHLIQAKQDVLNALNDDLNTPIALQIIDEVFSGVAKHSLADTQHQALVELLEMLDSLLGLELLANTPDIDDELKQLILERERAREHKDWQPADALRDQLTHQGITLSDTPHGVVWSHLPKPVRVE
ncbi:MAG TPA: cysteine--tRNA ligase [Verrucomicrobiae bacterium]|nr:cysteine--tRNA ligase [Verrucomicrobiae bacterium]